MTGILRSKAKGATLASTTYQKLREEIITGALPPGGRLNIRGLSDRFAIGLSPLREALNRLSAEGLVQQKDNHGFLVAPVSLDELADLTKARCWANEIGLREAIKCGGDEWEEELLLAFHRLKRTERPVAAGTARSPKWDAAHRAFHCALIAGCGSKWHIQSCEHLFDAAERYRHVARLAGANRSNHEEEHQAIMEAALDRRTEDAVRLLNEHFNTTANLVKKVVEN